MCSLRLGIFTSFFEITCRHSGLNSRIRTKRYEPLNNKGAPLPVRTFEEFRKTVVPMLLALGPYSVDDAVLLYKTLRILKAALGIVSTEWNIINYAILATIPQLYIDNHTMSNIMGF